MVKWNGWTNRSSCSALRTAFSECLKFETEMFRTARLSVTYFHIFLYYMHKHFECFCKYWPDICLLRPKLLANNNNNNNKHIVATDGVRIFNFMLFTCPYSWHIYVLFLNRRSLLNSFVKVTSYNLCIKIKFLPHRERSAYPL